MKQSTLLLLAMLLVASLPSRSQAELVTWGFSGEIDSVLDAENVLDGAVTVGTPFSGRFTFESTTPDGNPSNPRFGEYFGAIFGVSGNVGVLTFSELDGPSGRVLIRDNAPGAGTDRISFIAPTRLLDDSVSFSIGLVESTGTVFSSVAMPTGLLDLSVFDTARFGIELTPDGASFSGVLTDLVVVPEPATMILVMLGTICMMRRVQ